MATDRERVLEGSRAASGLDLTGMFVGQVASIEHTFDSEAVDRFAELCGDFSPLHVDDVYARETEFGGRVVHGMLLASLFSTLVGMSLPGRRALYVSQDLSFRRPVLVGERVVASAKVTSINQARRLLQLTTTIEKADRSVAVSGSGKVMVRGGAVTSVVAVPGSSVPISGGTKAALVTGASRGIGAAVAKRLAKDGYAVGINFRQDEAAARRVVRDIETSGGTAVAFRANIMEDSAVEEMIAAFVARFDGMDLLVNNAAPSYEMRSACDVRWPEMLEQLEGSVRAPLALAQAAYPLLRSRGGSIVNVLSQVVESQPSAQMVHYVVGKFGLLGLTRALAVEWAADGVRVNGVAPGLVQTDLTSHLAERVFKLEATRTPLRRLATPEDVAGAVSYLAGRDAEFVTGSVLSVSGGRVMN